MARTCVLTASDSTPDSGQEVVITATFSNDSSAVTITSLASLIAAQQAGFWEQMAQQLVGQTLAASGDTAITFPVVFVTGQPPSFVVSVDLQAFLSDGTTIDATGVDLTVSTMTLPGGVFPNDT